MQAVMRMDATTRSRQRERRKDRISRGRENLRTRNGNKAETMMSRMYQKDKEKGIRGEALGVIFEDGEMRESLSRRGGRISRTTSAGDEDEGDKRKEVYEDKEPGKDERGVGLLGGEHESSITESIVPICGEVRGGGRGREGDGKGGLVSPPPRLLPPAAANW